MAVRSQSTSNRPERFQISVNDDGDLYMFMDTWNGDTIANFLTRLANTASPKLVRKNIHLSFDGVRLGESTTIFEVSLDPCVDCDILTRTMQTGLADGDELALHYRPKDGKDECQSCNGSRKSQTLRPSPNLAMALLTFGKISRQRHWIHDSSEWLIPFRASFTSGQQESKHNKQ